VPPLLFVAIAIVLVGGMLLWVGALVDAAQYVEGTYEAVERDRRRTLLTIAVTWAFGGAWYWARIKPELRRSMAGPPR
jgi:hypothetical protein